MRERAFLVTKSASAEKKVLGTGNRAKPVSLLPPRQVLAATDITEALPRYTATCFLR